MTITNATPNTAANLSTGQMNVFNVTQTFASAVTAVDEEILWTAQCTFSLGGTFTKVGQVFNFPNHTTEVRLKGCTYIACKLRFASGGNWNKVALSNMTNCVVTGSGQSTLFPFLSGNSAWTNVVLQNTGQIVFDTDANVSSFNGVQLIDNNGGFWSESSANVVAYGLVFSGSTPSSMFVNNGTGEIRLWNSYTVLFARTRINSGKSPIQYGATRNILTAANAYFAAWDKNNAAAYTAQANASGVIAEQGIVTHRSTNTGGVGTIVYDDKLAGTGYTEFLYKYGFGILRNDVADYTTLNLGTPAPQNNGTAINIPIPLTADAVVTLTEANAAALDTAKFTYSAGTITTTDNTTASRDDLYDWLHWKTRQGIASMTRSGGTLPSASALEYASSSGTQLNLKALNLVMGAGSTLTVGTKLKSFITTGIASGTGTIQGAYQDSSGKRVVINGWPTGTTAEDGNSRLQRGVVFEATAGWDFANRATLNATLTVDTTTGSAVATLDPAKKYLLIADAHGYMRSDPIRIDPTTTDTVTIALDLIAKADGSPQLDGTQVAGQVAAVEWNAGENEIQLASSVTTISYQSFLVACEQLFTTSTAIIEDRPKPLYDFEGQTVYFPAGSTYHVCDKAGNTGRVTLPFAILRDGASSPHDAFCAAWETVHGLSYPTTFVAAPAQVLTTPERAAIASSVRTELATELGRLDVAISTRNAVAPDNASVTAIKAKTDNLPVDPASNTQVNTRLASASYTAPDNASVAAIKAKTDALPADPASNTQVNTRLPAASYTAPPSAAANATAVRAELGTELGRLDVAISTRNATAPPSAATVASAVRTELSSELAQVPGIKAKTDLLPADPAGLSGIRKISNAAAQGAQ